MNNDIIVNGFRKAEIHTFSIEVAPDSVFNVTSLKQSQEVKQIKANQINEEMFEQVVSQPPILLGYLLLKTSIIHYNFQNALPS